MAQFETGDMWSEFGKHGSDMRTLWIFTGNSYITKKDELAMGRGLALEVKTRFSDVPRLLGAKIRQPRFRAGDTARNTTNLAWAIYGVEMIPYEAADGFLGVFQVKRHFKDKAELALIGHSVLALQELVRLRKLKRIDLNFPGIGYGGLSCDKVLPIIKELPDSVHIWERDIV